MANHERNQRLKRYLAAAAVVAACTLISGINYWWKLPEASVVMIFLAGVAYTAARFGHGPALASVALSVIAFDYFFVVPVFAFAKVEPQHVITLAVMIAIGLVISELTSRVQRQLRASQVQERRTAQLYRLTRELAPPLDAAQLIATAGAIVGDLFDGSTVMFLKDASDSLLVRFASDRSLEQDASIFTAAQRACEQARLVQTQPRDPATALAVVAPMAGLQRTIGAICVQPRDAKRRLDDDERRTLETCANLVAMSLERHRLMSEAHRAQTQVETEQLRNSLLSSISHDLRTPLATIAMTTSGLLEGSSEQRIAEKRDVLETIVDQTRQLTRQVDNLLDMGRLNASPLTLECEWQVVEELVGVALRRLRSELAGHKIAPDIPADLPLLWAAGDLMGQVLLNLLDNAARYTPRGSQIEIAARRSGDRIHVTIADNGHGVPPGSEATLFDKFVRGPTKIADGRRGLGLGLTICRSIVRAHGGEVSARNRPQGGAEFLIDLPVRSRTNAPGRLDAGPAPHGDAEPPASNDGGWAEGPDTDPRVATRQSQGERAALGAGRKASLL